MRVIVAAVGVMLAACGSDAKLGEVCEVNNFFGTSNCAEGLLCIRPDACIDTGDCPGHCAKTCTADTECPSGCACNGTISEENGGGKRCSGAGC